MSSNKINKLDDKICINCLLPLTTDNTRTCDIAQNCYICKLCRKLRDKLRYQNKKEIIREQQRGYDLAVKMKIIEAYGWKCACCDENKYEFLTVDHINSDEAVKQITGIKLYRWLIKNNFPKEEYQLLCYNCSCAKNFFGYCPHNKPEITIKTGKLARKLPG
jgi:hypothetical protein